MTVNRSAAGRWWHRLAEAFTVQTRNYLCGRLSRTFTVAFLGPLIILCFVVGVTLGIAYCPTPYYVGRRWLSSLASANSNPSAYAYLGTALMVIAVLLVPLPGYLARRFEGCGRVSRMGLLPLWIGIGGMFLLGAETTVFPNVGRRTRQVHYAFTAMTVTGLTLGFLSYSALSLSRAWTAHASRWPAYLASAVLSIPAFGAGLTTLAMSFDADALVWAVLQTQKQARPIFLRLPFWEWASVLGLFAGGYLTVWAASYGHPRHQTHTEPQPAFDPMTVGVTTAHSRVDDGELSHRSAAGD